MDLLKHVTFAGLNPEIVIGDIIYGWMEVTIDTGDTRTFYDVSYI